MPKVTFVAPVLLSTTVIERFVSPVSRSATPAVPVAVPLGVKAAALSQVAVAVFVPVYSGAVAKAQL